MGMKIETIFEIRKQALKRLVDEAGSTAEFARKYDLNEDRVRHILNDVRTFGEKAARQWEERFGLPDFYFDMGIGDAITVVALFASLNPRDRQEVVRTAGVLSRQSQS